VTNDDGIYSPGITALSEVAESFGETRIVAPDVEMSSAGHSITASRPLTYKRTTIKDIDAYRVNGTPADCVALGAHEWTNVDLVLSGINIGSNIGNAIWHSGTLAAARQATLFGLRGVAFSAPSTEDPINHDLLKPWVELVLKMLIPLDGWSLINVNFPLGLPKGAVWTRQSVRHYDGKVLPYKDPMGRNHFWFTVIPLEEVEEGTDRHAVNSGYVSMTPLRTDLTDEDQLHNFNSSHSLKNIIFS